MSDTRVLSNIFTSRKTILELLQESHYRVEDYINFSRNEVDSMITTTQLDMLITHTSEEKKVYVKYYMNMARKQKQIQKRSLEDIIEDLFLSEQKVLSKQDTLIIIMDTEPNLSTNKQLSYLYESQGIFIVVHNIKSLLFNILKHDKVPHMEILNEEETNEFMEKYYVKDRSQLPEISRFDPHAKALCVRPNEICRIERKSPTALTTMYYRACVNE